MFDVNSPLLAEMIYDSPDGGDGNIPELDPAYIQAHRDEILKRASELGYHLNNPVLETVIAPSPNHSGPLTEDDIARINEEGQVVSSVPLSQLSPYPDPYNMVTGIGMQNYMPPQQYNYNYSYPQYNYCYPQQNYGYPQYNYGSPQYSYPTTPPNYIPQQQFAAPSGMYMDANQPSYLSQMINNTPGVVRGVQLPIKDYQNPYLGVGEAFGNRPTYDPRYGLIQPTTPAINFGYNQYPNQVGYPMNYQAEYMTPMDIQAQQEGFANGAEKIINDLGILKRLSIAAWRGAGSSEEEIAAMVEFKDKQISKAIDDYDNMKKNGTKSPIDMNVMLKNIEKEEKSMPTLTVRVLKGEEVVGCVEATPAMIRTGKLYPSYVLDNITRQHNQRVEYLNYIRSYAYEHAPERQMDNMGAVQFFNEGFGILHLRDKEQEWYMMAHDNTKLFNQEMFTRGLIDEYGTPQARARFERERARERKRVEENKKNKQEMTQKAYNGGATEDDIIREPNGFCLNKLTGEVWIEMPDEIAAKNNNNEVVNREAFKKRLENDIDLKVDDFLNRHVDSKLRQMQEQHRRIYNPNGSNSLILSPSSNEDSHYYGAKGNFMRETDTIRKFR